MIRKHKLFVRPKKAYQKTRIKEENQIASKYALKTKREIWKAMAKITYFRRRAKTLVKASSEEQQVFFGKLQKIGLKVNSIADVLDLKVENLLNRRLPTVVFEKGLAKTTKQARQMVVHKKVLINGRAVNIPSYIVAVADEPNITIVAKPIKVAKEESKPEGESN
jgi:small subunit ribosomal protein S4